MGAKVIEGVTDLMKNGSAKGKTKAVELLKIIVVENQKWTTEEEPALKVGVLKHGTGKWRIIHSDPVFSSVLRSRSNVDLKCSGMPRDFICKFIHGLGTELEFYNTLCEVNSPLKNHIPTVLASGILHLENGSYKIDSWDGKEVHDMLAKCNLILGCT
ncbi:hypothetical protein F3Y22_tig00110500pilonHSYRG00144 [Hibiscus syriacus]|uniref:MYB transcription factor n=1 Tax=Hibiscus syriacus TaxID=106335 RepID=A0A6A3AEG8_HIBSY|nr:hypothetical protein F3Y22_tig00110500pilonHSYRG00144 [Hibiscus syriacus]